MLEKQLHFAVTIVPADDLDATKDVSFATRRERLIDNAVATFRTNLDKAVASGELPKMWEKVDGALQVKR